MSSDNHKPKVKPGAGTQVTIEGCLTPARLVLGENDRNEDNGIPENSTPGACPDRPGGKANEDRKKRKNNDRSPLQRHDGDSPNNKIGRSGSDSEEVHDDDGMDINNGADDTHGKVTINEPLLAYITFALQTGTVENVKKAVIGFFTAEQIVRAKNVLWKNVHSVAIGKNVSRKSSNVRTEQEANVTDIVSAIQKLDKTNEMPDIVISALSLGKIPRSVPEELNAISIVDRLAKIEDLVKLIQESVVKNSNDIRMNKIEQAVTRQSCEQNSLPKRLEVPKTTMQESGWSGLQVEPWDEAAWSPSVPEGSKRAESFVDAVKNSRETCSRNQPYSQRGRGGIREGRGGQGGLSGARTNLLAPPEVLRLRGSNASVASSVNTDGFQLSSQDLKKQRRNDRRRRRVVTGKSSVPVDCKIKGAPEPDRDLFISRLDKGTNDYDFKSFIENNGFCVRKLQCVSHEDAYFKSYRLTVPKSEFPGLFNEDMWPTGVCVRKYVIPPRRVNEQNVDNL